MYKYVFFLVSNVLEVVEEDEHDESENGKPQVQVEFALGNFDGTPIGQAEDSDSDGDEVV